MNKESYESVDMSIIFFESADIITESNVDTPKEGF